jgi:hypothetical protein
MFHITRSFIPREFPIRSLSRLPSSQITRTILTSLEISLSLCRNRDLNLDARLNIDNDLLYHLSRRIQINQPLVNAHLEHIPGLAPLTTRCFSGCDLQGFGGKTDGALDTQVLGFRALEELGAHFFQRGDFARGERNADFVDFLWKWLGGGPMMRGRSGILGPRQSPSRAFGKTFL